MRASFWSEHNDFFSLAVVSVLQYATARVSWSVPVRVLIKLKWTDLLPLLLYEKSVCAESVIERLGVKLAAHIFIFAAGSLRTHELPAD